MRHRHLGLLVFFVATNAFAADHYVAPTGQATNDGSQGAPWDLATALAQPAAVKAGDTIWVASGTYTGHFTSKLTGTAQDPIVVRPVAGARATIDGNDGTNNVTLLINGGYAWYWGLEITNSGANRLTTDPNLDPTTRGEGVNLLGPGTKLINVVIHDTSQGVLSTEGAPDAEIHGCLVYYNGYDGPDRGHGHGFYIQNLTGKKTIGANIEFEQFSQDIHLYGVAGHFENIDIDSNVSFNNGRPSKVSGAKENILIGGENNVAHMIVLHGNFTYHDTSATGPANNLGYSAGADGPVLTDNYFMNGALKMVNVTNATLTNNTMFGATSGFTQSTYPGNTFTTTAPTTNKVAVIPNAYEPGRANIVVYDWTLAPTVDVDVSSVLGVGTGYELRNAQDFYAAPVLTGVFDGSPLHVPQTGLSKAPIIGWTPTPATTNFNVFVLLPTGPVTSPDGGVDPNPEAGTQGDGGTSSPPSSGCGCETGASSASAFPFALALLALMRRRQRVTHR